MKSPAAPSWPPSARLSKYLRGAVLSLWVGGRWRTVGRFGGKSGWDLEENMGGFRRGDSGQGIKETVGVV